MKVWFDRARDAGAPTHACCRSPRFRATVARRRGRPVGPRLRSTDGDTAFADELAMSSADLAWSMRADFQVTESLSPDDAVRAADPKQTGLVVLSDTGDFVVRRRPRATVRRSSTRCSGRHQGPSTACPSWTRPPCGVDGRGRRRDGDARSRRQGSPVFSVPCEVPASLARVGSGIVRRRCPGPRVRHGPDRGVRRRTDHGPYQLSTSGDRRHASRRLSSVRHRAVRLPDGRGESGLELPVVRADLLEGDPRRLARPDPVGHRRPALAADPEADLPTRRAGVLARVARCAG